MLDNRLTRRLLLSLVFVFFAFGSSFAYGYWQQISFASSAIIEFDSQTPQLQAETISTTVVAPLVPQGYAQQPITTDQVELQYRLTIDKEIARTMNLSVEATEVTIDGQPFYTNLVSIVIDGSPNAIVRDIFNEAIIVRAQIRLQEPIDADEAQRRGLSPSVVNVDDARAAYHAIAGKQLVIQFRFAITAKQP